MSQWKPTQRNVFVLADWRDSIVHAAETLRRSGYKVLVLN